MPGALAGITIIELAGIGPAPFAGMMLSDHGARVIRIERPVPAGRFADFGDQDVLGRNREKLVLDLKDPAAIARVRDMLRDADGLIEGFRPGVLERLGLVPDDLIAANPRLVIGRMTGWGQDGPMAQQAGHDINYIALSGALHSYGSKAKPALPVNAIGDFAGGGMMLAFGMLAAILSARSTGRGQVVDCAMVEGAALISAMTYNLLGVGAWLDERDANDLDGAAHYYDCYETADGKFMAVGAIEDQFYDLLLAGIGLSGDEFHADRIDRASWAKLKPRIDAAFRTKTRDEWCAIFAGSDACVAPVLSLGEAPQHPHNIARGTFITVDGLIQPGPVPRFSATPAPPVRLKSR